jgi:uncharacterized protein YqjF (DUF2071 family)
MTVNQLDLMHAGHRPYPPPSSPHLMRQTWSQLLFAHWRVSADELQKHVPAGVQLDLFENEAWVGIVPFQMSDVSLRGMPAVPGLSKFLELNVRTYVKHDDRPGVLFFSLDAANPIAVEAARVSYCLPYFHADMQLEGSNGNIEYRSQRKDKRGAAANLHVRYQPSGQVFQAATGSLEHWLTERYCLYTSCHGKLFRGEIHHQQWPLQQASAEFLENTMLSGLGLKVIDEKPLLHYADRLSTLEWPITRI